MTLPEPSNANTPWKPERVMVLPTGISCETETRQSVHPIHMLTTTVVRLVLFLARLLSLHGVRVWTCDARIVQTIVGEMVIVMVLLAQGSADVWHIRFMQKLGDLTAIGLASPASTAHKQHGASSGRDMSTAAMLFVDKKHTAASSAGATPPVTSCIAWYDGRPFRPSNIPFRDLIERLAGADCGATGFLI
jgi:hypothetical protein